MKRADEIFNTELLLTKLGKALFPKSDAALTAMGVVKNVSKLNTDLGQKSKHRRNLLLRVTKGLPLDFCKRELSIDPAYLRVAQHRSEKNPIPMPSPLETEGRREEGRQRYSDAVDQGLVDFLNPVHTFSVVRPEKLGN